MPVTTTIGLVSAGGLITNDGGSIISNDGASAGTGGGGIISNDGASVIGNDGASAVSTAGGSATLTINDLITNDGGSLITNDGGSLITNDGGSINAQVISRDGAGVISRDGAGFTSPVGSGFKAAGIIASGVATPTPTPERGWYIVRTSGGAKATTTFTNNPDGTVQVSTTAKLDPTSTPKLSELERPRLFAVVSNPVLIEFSSVTSVASEAGNSIQLTVNRSLNTTQPASVDYSTSDATAKQSSDYTANFGTLHFAPGETTKTITVLLTDDAFLEGQETFKVTLSNPINSVLDHQTDTVTVNVNDNDVATSGTNPNDNSRFFVRQHYLDFFGREPDPSGWDFWTNNIDSCGADTNCRAVKRDDTSAAFFLSIEFQETGFFVHRVYNAALNRTNGLPRYVEFLRDTRAIGNGVVVNANGWEQLLDSNKQSFLTEFVNRGEFRTLYPLGLSAAEFVDALYAHAGITPTAAERQAAIDEFNVPTGARERVLRRVAQNNSLTNREFSRAFVLAQYFGYLRRNPDDAPDNNLDGFNFWLTKLNNFGGDFRGAEMVKAFILSGEYRRRFGQ